MELEERMRQLGRLQRELLLWLSAEEEVKTREAIAQRWPPTRSTISHGVFSNLTAMIEGLRFSEDLYPYLFEEAPHAKYLTPGYLDSQAPRGVAWSAKRFLGRAPKRSESATLSKTLADLEKRGLIETHKSVGKRQRTSHLSITVYGALAALLIRRRRGE